MTLLWGPLECRYYLFRGQHLELEWDDGKWQTTMLYVTCMGTAYTAAIAYFGNEAQRGRTDGRIAGCRIANLPGRGLFRH